MCECKQRRSPTIQPSGQVKSKNARLRTAYKILSSRFNRTLEPELEHSHRFYEDRAGWKGGNAFDLRSIRLLHQSLLTDSQSIILSSSQARLVGEKPALRPIADAVMDGELPPIFRCSGDFICQGGYSGFTDKPLSVAIFGLTSYDPFTTLKRFLSLIDDDYERISNKRNYT